MNRPCVGATKSALCVLFVALLGAAPAPLVVGSVRDQEGAPIAGARVRLVGSPVSTAVAQTATDGTFAIEGAGSAVQIRCDYCRPTQLRLLPTERLPPSCSATTPFAWKGPAQAICAACPTRTPSRTSR